MIRAATWLAAAFLLLLAWMVPGAAEAAGVAVFDHFTTGYELTGAHRVVPCDACHVDAVFVGTPTDCAGCHGVGTRIAATPRPATHIPSSDNCTDCHTTSSWLPAEFSHDGIVDNCGSCHNGATAAGKTPDHILTTSTCEACHVIEGWVPTTGVDHTQVLGSCSTGHDGTAATGKTPDHIMTTEAVSGLAGRLPSITVREIWEVSPSTR